MAGMKLIDINNLQTFDCSDTASLAPRWKRWLRSFELYSDGKGIRNAEQKKALLLHTAGLSVQDIFFTLVLPADGDAYEKTKTALNDYFQPRVNVPYERHMFRAMCQTNETVSQFITRLRQQADNCEFGDIGQIEERIRDQVIEKCTSHTLRMKLLEKGGALSLDNLLTVSRAQEESESQARSIEKPLEVNAMRNSTQTGFKKFENRGNFGKNFKSDITCYRCGNKGHISKDESCPARKKTCSKCKIKGHFERMCRTKMTSDHTRKPQTGRRGKGHGKFRQMTNCGDDKCDNDHDTDFAFMVKEKHATELHDGKIEANIGGISLTVLIDSGSTCNVIGCQDWNNLKNAGIKCTSQRKTRDIFPYGSNEPLPVLGTFNCDITAGEVTVKNAEFVVVKHDGPPLLGRILSQKLGILVLGPNMNLLHSPRDFVKEFPKLFTGFGKLKDYQLTVPIVDEVTPVIQPLRRIPYHLQDKLDKKLEELETYDIIEKVSGPSDWVSPLVIVPKPGGKDIRVCVDMRVANGAVQRVRHQMPTIDDVLQDLNKSSVFSKLDVRWAYHQIELSPESRHITTFSSPKGLYRYKRLMFGICCAPEMYQKILQQVLQGCEGVRNIMDDIIVHGATVEEHDLRMAEVLSVLMKKGLTLNAEKCQFRMEKLKFLGHVLSEEGVSPAEAKVKAVLETREPSNAKEVRSFLGLVNFNGRFIENLATISEPLRRLTRKTTKFEWGPEQQKSFDKLKECLASAEVLGYFDKHSTTQVIADASPVGIGAVHKGVHKVISYASKSLSDIEKRYSQTEKEALALVWACEHFHKYLYGAPFELLTDHRPLQFIYAPRSKPCARIERWVLRMQGYDYRVKYIKGTNNIADCLSRLGNTSNKSSPASQEAEQYIRFVATESSPVAMMTRDIERASDRDEELNELRSCLLSGKWYTLKNTKYLPMRNELSAVGKLVLRGTRIVIPCGLRVKVLALAHEGHPGIIKMKQRLRSKVWWPGIDLDVEKYCKSCHGCQVVSSENSPPPVYRTPLPTSPWQHLAVDLMGPLPTGEHVLVVIDYYSRYFELDVIKSTTSETIIDCLSRMFLTHGLPLSLQTDNGRQFVSEKFRNYLKHNGIKHTTSTPYWPQANGEVERQNRTILKRIRIAQVEGKNWKTEMDPFLIMYRSTPHTTTGKTPSELLFGRTIRTKLPGIDDFGCDFEVRDHDSELKRKGKDYIDCKRNAKPSAVETGDKVLMKKQIREDKFSTNFHKVPCTVVNKYGNMVEVETEDGQLYKRNVTHVKNYVSKADVPDATTGHAYRSVTVNAENLNGSRPQRERTVPTKYKDFVLGFMDS